MGSEITLKKEWIEFAKKFLEEHPEINFYDFQDVIYRQFFKGKFVKNPWFTTKCIADEAWKNVGR